MKKINDMFHIDGEQLIKTSNGQSIPDDEPIFILRGRDMLSIATLTLYRDACKQFGTPQDRLLQLDQAIEKFREYHRTHTTKIPGSTHGK